MNTFIFDDGWGNYTIAARARSMRTPATSRASRATSPLRSMPMGRFPFPTTAAVANTLGASAGLHIIRGGSGTNTSCSRTRPYSTATSKAPASTSSTTRLHDGHLPRPDHDGRGLHRHDRRYNVTSLGTGYATGVKGVNNISRVNGGSSAGDVLMPHTDNIWTIDSLNSGSINGSEFTFSGIESLVGLPTATTPSTSRQQDGSAAPWAETPTEWSAEH